MEARELARAGGSNTTASSATANSDGNSQTQPARTSGTEATERSPPNGVGGAGQAGRSGARQSRPRQPADRTNRQPDNLGCDSGGRTSRQPEYLDPDPGGPPAADTRRGRRDDGVEPRSGGQGRSSGATVSSRGQASPSAVFNPYAGVAQSAPTPRGGGGEGAGGGGGEGREGSGGSGGRGLGGEGEGRGGGEGGGGIASEAAAATMRSDNRKSDGARPSTASDGGARRKEVSGVCQVPSADCIASEVVFVGRVICFSAEAFGVVYRTLLKAVSYRLS